jgi:hypothetical protein
VYYYTSGMLNGLHGTIGMVNGTLNGLHRMIGTVNGTLNNFGRNCLNGQRNAERFEQNDLNGERLEWFESFSLDFKICISETLTTYYFHHLFTICLFIYKY